MTGTKALVVYETCWGNTEKVARAIAQGIAELMEVRVVGMEAAEPPGDDVAFMVAGGPTHALSMTRPRTRADAVDQGADRVLPDRGLREWIASLPVRADGPPVYVFDTRLHTVRHLPGSAAAGAARALRRRGWRTVGRPRSFSVGATDGPVLSGELERAGAWGREMAAAAGLPAHRR